MHRLKHWAKIVGMALSLLLFVDVSHAGLISALIRLLDDVGSAAPATRRIDDVPVREAPPRPDGLYDDMGRALDNAEDPVPVHVGGDKVEREVLRAALDITKQHDTFMTAAHQPQLLVAMPTNPQQYKKVYQAREVSLGAEEQLEHFAKQVHGAQGAVDVAGGRVDLFAHIQNADGSPVVIFAHSDEGGKRLFMSNGETLLDKEIHQQCARAGKLCAVLTCYGDDFALRGEVTAGQAMSMWQSAHQSMQKASLRQQSVSNGQFISTMRARKSALDLQHKARVGLSFSGPVGPVYYYYSSADDQES